MSKIATSKPGYTTLTQPTTDKKPFPPLPTKWEIVRQSRENRTLLYDFTGINLEPTNQLYSARKMNLNQLTDQAWFSPSYTIQSAIVF